MTDLENKIWSIVHTWAKAQAFNFNEFALRGLMDDILALVNESSKDAEIKKLVEHYKCKAKVSDYGVNFRFKTSLVRIEEIITKLENILTDGTKRSN
jgi:hypothetical protein